MNDDERFEQYLNQRADQLDVPTAGRAAVVARAARRRHRRRAGTAAGLVAFALVGGAVVIGQGNRPEPAEKIQSFAHAGTGTPLDWTTVDVKEGIGWLTDSVVADRGIYSLSTAPGDRTGRPGPRHLYASTDGTEWSEAPLPFGLHANALAADGDHLYAVGTGAPGGSVSGPRLARTVDPAKGWDQVDLPLHIDDLVAGFPGVVAVQSTDVVVGSGATVVSVQVSGTVDIPRLLPGEDTDGWWEEADGLHHDTCAAVDSPGSTVPSTTTEAGADPELSCSDASSRTEVRTWAELGVDPDVSSLIAGRTYLFASTECCNFLTRPFVVEGTGPGTALLADGPGFRLVTNAPLSGTRSMTRSWTSADGLTWTLDAAELEGATSAAGALGERPAVLTTTDSGRFLLHVFGPAGPSLVDLSAVLGIDSSVTGVSGTFGPLGAAFIFFSDSGEAQVAFTADGTTFSSASMPRPEPDTRQSVNGVTVTADAVKVRLSVRAADDVTGEGPARQRLLVGTPKG